MRPFCGCPESGHLPACLLPVTVAGMVCMTLGADWRSDPRCRCGGAWCERKRGAA